MKPDLDRYSENIKYTSKLDPSDESAVISEIEAHIEDKLQDLAEAGFPRDKAVSVCLTDVGSPAQVARQIYEAYSQGSWKQVLLASMPHLLFALLFVLNWWQHAGWLMLLLFLILGATLYGWWHGKPGWVFPWMGYSLLPVLLVGSILIYLPRGWSLLAIPIYIPLALWWMIHIILESTKKDWLFGSLMLLPVPVAISWFLSVSPRGQLTGSDLERVYHLAPWISLSFLALALTIAAFIRLRQRHLKILLLLASELFILSMIAYAISGRLTLLTFVGPALTIWGILLLPSFLERRLRNGHLWLGHHGGTAPV